MSEPSINVSYRDKVDVYNGYYMMIGTFVLFHVVKMMIREEKLPKSMNADFYEFRNIIISWLHASVSGLWCILSFILYPSLTDDLVFNMNYFVYFVSPFSTGYFIYDTIDLIMTRKFKKNTTIVFHHIVMTTIIGYQFHYKTCICLAAIGLLAEVNSSLLHARKLMQMFQFQRDGVPYRGAVYMNFITFLIFRFLANIVLVYHLIFNVYHRVAIFHFIMFSFALSFAIIHNIEIFGKLVKSDFYKISKKSKNN